MARGGAGVLALVWAVIVGPAVCGRAQAATATAAASCEILPVIEVTREADLAFGSVRPGSAPGELVITPEGATVPSSGILAPANGGARPAVFVVCGVGHATYRVALPQSIQITSGAESMVVTGFTTGTGTGVLNGDGTQRVRVGATLHIKPQQPRGQYSGSFAITVAYE